VSWLVSRGNGNEICALYCVESYCSYWPVSTPRGAQSAKACGIWLGIPTTSLAWLRWSRTRTTCSGSRSPSKCWSLSRLQITTRSPPRTLTSSGLTEPRTATLHSGSAFVVAVGPTSPDWRCTSRFEGRRTQPRTGCCDARCTRLGARTVAGNWRSQVACQADHQGSLPTLSLEPQGLRAPRPGASVRVRPSRSAR
jgi:hypothetical protein